MSSTSEAMPSSIPDISRFITRGLPIEHPHHLLPVEESDKLFDVWVKVLKLSEVQLYQKVRDAMDVYVQRDNQRVFDDYSAARVHVRKYKPGDQISSSHIYYIFARCIIAHLRIIKVRCNMDVILETCKNDRWSDLFHSIITPHLITAPPRVSSNKGKKTTTTATEEKKKSSTTPPPPSKKRSRDIESDCDEKSAKSDDDEEEKPAKQQKAYSELAPSERMVLGLKPPKKQVVPRKNKQQQQHRPAEIDTTSIASVDPIPVVSSSSSSSSIHLQPQQQPLTPKPVTPTLSPVSHAVASTIATMSVAECMQQINNTPVNRSHSNMIPHLDLDGSNSRRSGVVVSEGHPFDFGFVQDPPLTPVHAIPDPASLSYQSSARDAPSSFVISDSQCCEVTGLQLELMNKLVKYRDANKLDLVWDVMTSNHYGSSYGQVYRWSDHVGTYKEYINWLTKWLEEQQHAESRYARIATNIQLLFVDIAPGAFLQSPFQSPY